MARFDSVLSFSRDDPDVEDQQPTEDQQAEAGAHDDSDDDDDAGFEFAFAPPLTAAGRDAEDALLVPADDLFAHGRILPAYPVFDRRRVPAQASSAQTAPPSPDTYCSWAPRSAPGSPARDLFPKSADLFPESTDLFPKSASTGDARRSWRLRDILGGRSHSDGKEKFVFLQPSASSAAPPSIMSKMAAEDKQAKKPSGTPLQHKQQKQSKKKKGTAVTEMDMATAHKLFYGKQGGAGALAGGDRKQQHSSYLPYRTGIVGFFTTAHAIGRSHHPY